jgi:type I restriction enzyme, S subunit
MSALASRHWKEVTFAAIVEDSAFGPRFSGGAYSDDGNISTLRTTDISEDGRISYETMPRARLDEAKFSKHLLRPGDLVITRSGRVGTTAVFEEHPGPVLPGAFLIRFRLRDNANPQFFRYWFNSRSGQQRLLSVAHGAAQQNINITNVEKLKVFLPPIAVQRQIASILSAYDDLIENNRRRITLLEQTARLLYKEWFVRLRFPGHEHVKIIDGVPQGWEKKLISELCETVGGGTPSTNNFHFWEDGDILWVVPTDVTRNGCLALLDTEKKITQAGLRDSSAKLVPPDTILMTSRASVGFFAIMEQEVCTNQGFINIIPHKEGMRMYILYNLMHRVEEIRSNAGGATYKEISKGRFRNMEIVAAPLPLCQQFSEFAYSSLQQTRLLLKQNSNLTKARNLLLPRLMNGELGV